jgi:hypothetical protein
VNGLKVSANQPKVLQEEAFGLLFNTKLDGDKLKSEIWINLVRVDELGDEVKKSVEALQSGELVEISTGLIADIEVRKGTFKGQSFDGIWRNVTPDHLAILPEGVVGACSVEDGCGAPRVNAACGPGCQCFDSKGQKLSKHKHKKKRKKVMAEPNPDDGKGKQNAGDPNNPDPSITPNAEGGFRTFVTKFMGLISFKSGDEEVALRNAAEVIRANKELADFDIKKSLMVALGKEGEATDPFIIALFSDSFVYEPDWSGKLLQRSFTLDNKGNATLGSKTTEVRPITEFVPASKREEGDTTMPDAKIAQKVDALVANERTKFTDEHKDWLVTLNMSQLEALEPEAEKEVKASEDAEVAAKAKAEAEKAAASSESGSEEAKEPPTTEQFLSTASPEIREVLNEGVSLRNQRRDDLVKGLKANERCSFTEDELKAMSLDGLEKLARIANIPSFAGQGGGLRTHMGEDPSAVPEAPSVFDLPERKSA